MAMQSYEQQGEESNEAAGRGRAVREEEEAREEGGQQGAQGAHGCRRRGGRPGARAAAAGGSAEGKPVPQHGGTRCRRGSAACS